MDELNEDMEAGPEGYFRQIDSPIPDAEGFLSPAEGPTCSEIFSVVEVINAENINTPVDIEDTLLSVAAKTGAASALAVVAAEASSSSCAFGIVAAGTVAKMGLHLLLFSAAGMGGFAVGAVGFGGYYWVTNVLQS